MATQGKLSLWLTVAGSTTDTAFRKTGWGLFTGGGWKSIVNYILARRDMYNINTVYLRGPAGDDGKWPLDFAAPSWAFESMQKRAIVAAFKPLIDDGFEIIPYFGSLTQGPYMKRKFDERDPVGWLSLFKQNINPWLDAGCGTLAFDHIGASTQGTDETPAYWAVRCLRTFGMKVLIEPHGKPSIDRVDGCVVTEEHWQKAWTRHINRAEMIRRHEAGEPYRVVRIAHTTEEALRILDEGYECAAAINPQTSMAEIAKAVK